MTQFQYFNKHVFIIMSHQGHSYLKGYQLIINYFILMNDACLHWQPLVCLIKYQKHYN